MVPSSAPLRIPQSGRVHRWMDLAPVANYHHHLTFHPTPFLPSLHVPILPACLDFHTWDGLYAPPLSAAPDECKILLCFFASTYLSGYPFRQECCRTRVVNANPIWLRIERVFMTPSSRIIDGAAETGRENRGGEAARGRGEIGKGTRISDEI